jgi:hypothetical protein
MNILTDIIPPRTAVRLLMAVGALFGTAAGTYVGVREVDDNIQRHGHFHYYFAYAAASRALEGFLLGALLFPYPVARILSYVSNRKTRDGGV